MYTTALCAFHAMRSTSKTFKHWTSLRPRIMAETAAMEACVHREVVEENNGSLTHLAVVRELARDCIQPVPGDIVGDFTEAVADQNFVWNSVVISLHYHALAPLLEQYPAVSTGLVGVEPLGLTAHMTCVGADSHRTKCWCCNSKTLSPTHQQPWTRSLSFLVSTHCRTLLNNTACQRQLWLKCT